MNSLKLTLVSFILATLLGCSTMSTNRFTPAFSSLTAIKAYQLKVRSGNVVMDKVIYDYASARIGRHLRLRPGGDDTGSVEIVFNSISQKGFSVSTAGYSRDILYGDNWYTGDASAWLQDYSLSEKDRITPARGFSWQNSVMTVTIKDPEGKILWGAQYNYKGLSDLSAISINTADEAARLSLDRIIVQFEREFIVPLSARQIDSKKKSTSALIIVPSGDIAGPAEGQPRP